MNRRTALINDLRIFKKSLSREIPIKKMILFGSYATGKTHRWSDIDLIVVSNKFRKKKRFSARAARTLCASAHR